MYFNECGTYSLTTINNNSSFASQSICFYSKPSLFVLPASSLLFSLFRDIYPSGNIYEGGFNMGDKHGKGEHEFYESGERGVGQWISGKEEGEFKIYDKEGNMTVKHFKDGVELEN